MSLSILLRPLAGRRFLALDDRASRGLAGGAGRSRRNRDRRALHRPGPGRHPSPTSATGRLARWSLVPRPPRRAHRLVVGGRRPVVLLPGAGLSMPESVRAAAGRAGDPALRRRAAAARRTGTSRDRRRATTRMCRPARGVRAREPDTTRRRGVGAVALREIEMSIKALRTSWYGARHRWWRPC
ncbi:MAG: hypothetical protein MZW92_58065 [Comamonadaceae bacterium]|nr:hypothetical protein [Comamonadaceae bacterium]